MVKLIALDLDNTLLNENNQISEVTLKLLRKCSRKGIVITIATGRLFYSAEKYAKQISFDSKIVCYNGALIVGADETVIFESKLDIDIMKQVADFCKVHDLYCQFYDKHKILVEKVCEGTTIDPDLQNTEAIEVGSFADYNFQPSPKAMIVVEPSKLKAYQDELAKVLGNQVYIAQSQNYLIEIMPNGVNKAAALSILCDKLGIKNEEVMACGDNTNDAEMVKWAGIGVAVANSVEALKESADYICKNERSIGVAEAIQRFCGITSEEY